MNQLFFQLKSSFYFLQNTWYFCSITTLSFGSVLQLQKEKKKRKKYTMFASVQGWIASWLQSNKSRVLLDTDQGHSLVCLLSHLRMFWSSPECDCCVLTCVNKDKNISGFNSNRLNAAYVEAPYSIFSPPQGLRRVSQTQNPNFTLHFP